MNLNEIKSNYEKFDDSVLIKLATKEIHSLRPEVIPLLKAEIQKRNLSLDNNEYTQEKSFENSFPKEKILYSVEHLDYFKSTSKIQLENVKNKSFFLSFFLKSITFIILIFTIFLFLSFKFNWVIQLILLIILILSAIKVIQEKKDLGKIAQLKKDTAILSQYPIINFNIFRILATLQIGLNGLRKIEVEYKYISKIYKKKTLFNNGYYVNFYNKTINDNMNKRIYLEGLEKKDLKEFLELIKYKCIESKNNNVV